MFAVAGSSQCIQAAACSTIVEYFRSSPRQPHAIFRSKAPTHDNSCVLLFCRVSHKTSRSSGVSDSIYMIAVCITADLRFLADPSPQLLYLSTLVAPKSSLQSTCSFLCANAGFAEQLGTPPLCFNSSLSLKMPFTRARIVRTYFICFFEEMKNDSIAAIVEKHPSIPVAGVRRSERHTFCARKDNSQQILKYQLLIPIPPQPLG